MNLEKFRNIDFHDQSIEEFSINFLSKNIYIKFSIYNETIDDYDILDVNFVNSENINFESFSMNELSEIEISSCVIKQLKDKINIEFKTLLSFSGPSFNFSFDCSDVIFINKY